MSIVKFESMLKTNNIYFFDLVEFEEIIIHYLDVGKHTLAKKAVQLGLQQHPQSVDLKLLHVEICIFEDNLDKATTLLQVIEKLNPENDEVFIQKATIASKRGNHKEALNNLKKGLQFTSDKVDIWSLMGMEYLYLDDYENARLNFAKCIDVDYEDYSALYNIVYCFDMEKEHEQAIIYLNAYIDKNPYCEVAWHQLGRQYFIIDRYKEALASFEYAVLIDESFIGGYLEKAKTLEKLGRFDEAIENYLITLDLDDPTAFAYLKIGECYENLEKYEAAISFYKKAVHEDPLLDRGWILLTNMYFVIQDYQKAAYYITKALKIDDSNPLYWRKYAEIHTKIDFYEEAIEGYNNCLALQDNDIEVYIALVDLLVFLGEFDYAIKHLQKAQKIYRDFAEIEYRLGGLLLLTEQEKLGLAYIEKGLKIDAEYSSIIRELFPTVYEQKTVQTLLDFYS